MQRDIVKYAHGLKRIWVHMSFKIKYCHEVFNHPEIREECQNIFEAVADDKKLELYSSGFDANHAHFIIDLGNYSEPQVKKWFKGTSARKLKKKFPWLKQKYFWGGGFWGRQYYCYSIGSDMKVLNAYIRKQKFFVSMHEPSQTTLGEYHLV